MGTFPAPEAARRDLWDRFQMGLVLLLIKAAHEAADDVLDLLNDPMSSPFRAPLPRASDHPASEPEMLLYPSVLPLFPWIPHASGPLAIYTMVHHFFEL